MLFRSGSGGARRGQAQQAKGRLLLHDSLPSRSSRRTFFHGHYHTPADTGSQRALCEPFVNPFLPPGAVQPVPRYGPFFGSFSKNRLRKSFTVYLTSLPKRGILGDEFEQWFHDKKRRFGRMNGLFALGRCPPPSVFRRDKKAAASDMTLATA